MILKVLGSSSSGNCYVLEGENESLIMECGINFSTIKKHTDISKLLGVCITHEHNDHCKSYANVVGSGIPVFSSKGTNSILKDRLKNSLLDRFFIDLDADTLYSVGGFKIYPFDVLHDVEQPFAYVIEHEECGRLLFATDTKVIPKFFSSLNHILVECNYDFETMSKMIANGDTPMFLSKRVIQSHLGLESCITYLKQTDLSSVQNIVLLHLSNAHSNARLMKRAIIHEFGKTCYIADKGLIIDL